MTGSIQWRLIAGLTALLLLVAACADDRIDREFPPGDPVLEQPGDNPVLGSTGPGAIAETDSTNYGLLTLIAVCLIGAGVLLVRVERWERRRNQATRATDP